MDQHTKQLTKSPVGVAPAASAGQVPAQDAGGTDGVLDQVLALVDQYARCYSSFDRAAICGAVDQIDRLTEQRELARAAVAAKLSELRGRTGPALTPYDAAGEPLQR